MIDKHYIELMNREIDGVATHTERADLRAYLNGNPEARAHYDELRSVDAAFKRAGSVEPPANFEETLIASVTEREVLCEARETLPARLVTLLTPRRKLAYSFAAGLACGLIILGIILTASPVTDRLDVKNLYGALTGRQKESAIVAEERLPIAMSGVSGSIAALYRERSITLELDLDSQAEIATTVAPAGSLSIESFSAPSGGVSGILTDAAGLTLRSTGRCRFAITFKDEAGGHPAVNVVMRSGGNTIFDQTISRGRK